MVTVNLLQEDEITFFHNRVALYSKMKKTNIIVTCAAALLALAWIAWPSLVVGSVCFSDPKGEESGRRACDRIVGVGPRAIPAIIRSLKGNGPWSRGHSYLPIALRELGEPAHEALIEAIDTEQDPSTRAKLVDSLQNGFQDYSRLSAVIKDAKAGHVKGYPLHMMGAHIRGEFTNAPPFQTGDPLNGTVNPAFAEWWKQHGEPNSGDSCGLRRGHAPTLHTRKYPCSGETDSEQWNQTCKRLDALQDEQVQGFLDSKDKDENKAARMILEIRKIQREWTAFQSEMKSASFQQLVGRLNSSNDTEVAVALSNLAVSHKEAKTILLPLFVEQANKRKDGTFRFFLGAIESLTGKSFGANSFAPDNQLLNKLNDWWREHKAQFTNGEPGRQQGHIVTNNY
jgi:hypothetical protein